MPLKNIWPFDSFKTSTTYNIKSGKVKSTTGGMVYKGYKIYRTREGFEVPSIEKGTEFESIGEAKRFINYWAKQRNPNKMAWEYIVLDSRTSRDTPRSFKKLSTATKFAKTLPGDNEIYKANYAKGIASTIVKTVKGKQKNPGATSNSSWIPCHAIKVLPTGDIQLLTEKGTMSNPGKRKSFLKKVEKTFGKVVKTVKRKM